MALADLGRHRFGRRARTTALELLTLRFSCFSRPSCPRSAPEAHPATNQVYLRSTAGVRRWLVLASAGLIESGRASALGASSGRSPQIRSSLMLWAFAGSTNSDCTGRPRILPVQVEINQFCPKRSSYANFSCKRS